MGQAQSAAGGAEDEVPVDRVRKRIERLLRFMREHALRECAEQPRQERIRDLDRARDADPEGALAPEVNGARQRARRAGYP